MQKLMYLAFRPHPESAVASQAASLLFRVSTAGVTPSVLSIGIWRSEGPHPQSSSVWQSLPETWSLFSKKYFQISCNEAIAYVSEHIYHCVIRLPFDLSVPWQLRQSNSGELLHTVLSKRLKREGQFNRTCTLVCPTLLMLHCIYSLKIHVLYDQGFCVFWLPFGIKLSLCTSVEWYKWHKSCADKCS